MEMTDKERDLLRRMEKSAKAPLWPAIGALIAGSFIAIFHRERFGIEGFITIEVLFSLLILLALKKKIDDRKIMTIIQKKLDVVAEKQL